MFACASHRHDRIEAAGVVVVEQQTHAHASVGSLAEPVEHQRSGVVAVKDVGLDVDRALGGFGEPGPRREGFAPSASASMPASPGCARTSDSVARPSRVAWVSASASETGLSGATGNVPQAASSSAAAKPTPGQSRSRVPLKGIAMFQGASLDLSPEFYRKRVAAARPARVPCYGASANTK